MRRFTLILALLAGLVLPAAVVAAPADADRGSPRCVTLHEWRQIKTGMTRWRVKQIVGFNGKQSSRTTHYGDGTIDFPQEYRMCKRNSHRRAAWWMTTTMWFGTETKYGKKVWDSCADYDYDYNCLGAYVWDEWAPNGHTTTPTLNYKGSF